MEGLLVALPTISFDLLVSVRLFLLCFNSHSFEDEIVDNVI
jgi:hypothetical protein